MSTQREKEEFIGEVLEDLNFQIHNQEHRAGIAKILGGEDEVLALEAFLKDRAEDERQFYKECYELED